MAQKKPLRQSGLTTYQVGVIQAAAQRTLKKQSDACLKRYGLTTTQWRIIGTVLDYGPKGVRITDLAKKVDVTLAFLTNAVNLLELKKILERLENAEDNRSRMVRVTKKFQPMCAKIESDLRRDLRSSFYSKITPEELSTYLDVLYKFSELG